MRKELSDTHRVILANAAGRENLRVLPVPSTISDNLVAIDSAVTDLLGDGLLAEIPADLSDTIWCKRDDAANTTLRITELGLRAMGISQDDDVSQIGDHHGTPLPEVPPVTSKLQAIVALMQRPQGATLEELASATGWQKHSVRGAISGALKKKHSYIISSTLVDGRGRVYRIETFETPIAGGGRSAAAVNEYGHGSGS